MKKALQIHYLRAVEILPERAVVSGPRKAQCSGFCDHFAELFVTNLARERSGLLNVLREGLRRRPRSRFVGRRKRLRDGAWSEREARRRVLPETRADLFGAALELEGPDRVGRVHVKSAVTREPCGPRVASDCLADRGRPGLDDRRHAGSRAEASQLAPDVTSDALHHAARTRPGVTSSSIAGSTGSEDASVAVTSVWPACCTRSASARRRLGSSSDSTSSSRSSGAKPRRSEISSASASRRARTVRRCSPCEPKLRRSRGPLESKTSSRCGPTPVEPRSRSRSRRASNASTVGGSPSYVMRAAGSASSAARSAKPGASAAITSPRASTSSRPSEATCSVHGARASRDEYPPATRRNDALRCATAAA